jgi:hypothetical protein
MSAIRSPHHRRRTWAAAATQEPGCDRRDIAGLYWVRQVNTLVVDVGGPNPTMMLVKGSYDPGKARNWSLAPTGLIAFGGAGRADLRDFVLISCGNAATCNGDKAGMILLGGVERHPLPGRRSELAKPSAGRRQPPGACRSRSPILRS